MTVDELKSMPKGNFILMKTGARPMQTKLRLFTKWGIKLNQRYEIEMRTHQKVEYANISEIEMLLKMQDNGSNIKQHISFKNLKEAGIKVE